MNISLRKIQEGDLPFLFEVYASTREQEVAQSGWPPAQQIAFLKMQFDAQHTHYQTHYPEASFDLVLLNDQQVGRLYVSHWPTQIRIVDIAFMPNYRGRGLGSSLMRGLMQQGIKEGKVVSIHVEKNNPAMAWYQSLGFFPVEDKGVYTLMKTRLKSKPLLEV